MGTGRLYSLVSIVWPMYQLLRLSSNIRGARCFSCLPRHYRQENNNNIIWMSDHALHLVTRLQQQQQPRRRTRRRTPQSPTTKSTSTALDAATTTTTSTAAVDLQYADYTCTTRGQEQQDCLVEQAPPVVLLHGLLGNKRNFATVANSLASQLEKPRRIIALDLRNHGDNDHDWRDGMSYEEMADDVLAWLDKQGIDKVVLVGHSMGGKVGQAIALLHPHRVDGLVVLDIAPVRYSEHDDPHWKAVHDIVHALKELPIQPGVTKREIDALLRPTINDPALRAFCLTNIDVKAGQWKIDIQSISNELPRLADFDLSNSQNNNDDDGDGAGSKSQNNKSGLQYPGDAFFIHGGQSRFVKHSHLTTIAEFFPNHMLTTIKSVGHWVHAEAPDDTTALLKRFLDR